MNPMIGNLVARCARAEDGEDATSPPNPARKSRRRMRDPFSRSSATYLNADEMETAPFGAPCPLRFNAGSSPLTWQAPA